MRYFLCGNTGVVNRGCEAIVRSTVKVLNQKRSGDIYLSTFAPIQDTKMCKELGINLISYNNYPTKIHRYFYVGIRKLIRGSLFGVGVLEKPLFDKLTPNDICLTIGGDTYCYGRPIMNLALNKFTTKNKIKNILWCCSIEKSKMQGEILQDLKRYDYIFAREIITYNNLIESGLDKNKVIKCCDPAFFLDTKRVPLPDNFVEGNTVGINVSSAVIKNSNPLAYKNVINLINYIINNTDMSVCLVPHVYKINGDIVSDDYKLLKKIYDEVNSPRISIVDKEYDCEELKYIISHCRFFVGARTHSTIAAYSTEVPTLVIGYSVKSKGIATDLFGTYKDYVIPYEELTQESMLTDTFKKLVDNETKIKERYREFLPIYKSSLLDNVAKYVTCNNVKSKEFKICDHDQCTGCMACVSVCPKNCIQSKRDKAGFEYPSIDFNKCINCSKCRNICPVANKPKDTNQQPNAFAMQNKDEQVRLESSSGGCFTVIAEHIIDMGGVVFGVGYDSSFNAINKSCTTKADLTELRGSKYVQSNVQNVYTEAEVYLKQGRTVYFTGTPCQIGGLKAYLGQDYGNLYTQDIICHGVPSPNLWNNYVEYREQIAGSKATNVQFRDKSLGWDKYAMLFEFDNQTNYNQRVTDDIYMRCYIMNMAMRKSCAECSFKQVHRQSDFTIADFWGIDKVCPEMNDNKGTSLLLVHSDKGQKLLSDISDRVIIKQVDFELSIGSNPSMIKSVKLPPLYNMFMKDLPKMRVDKLINKYCGLGFMSRLRRILAKYL